MNNKSDLGKKSEITDSCIWVTFGAVGCIMSAWAGFSGLNLSSDTPRQLADNQTQAEPNLIMKRHIMFLETLTWRQITDLFKKV